MEKTLKFLGFLGANTPSYSGGINSAKGWLLVSLICLNTLLATGPTKLYYVDLPVPEV